MHWTQSFARIEARLAEESHTEAMEQVHELARAERAGLTLADRLRGSPGARLILHLCTGLVIDAHLDRAGPTWLLVSQGTRQLLIPLSAICAISNLGHFAAPPPGSIERGLGLAPALRSFAAEHSIVDVVTLAYSGRGTIAAVASDHFDLDVSANSDSCHTGGVAIPFTAMVFTASR